MLRLTRLFREMAPELQLEYVPLLFTRTILGPNGGFAGEERLVKLEMARKYIEDGDAVMPTEELRQGLWCFNPDTNQYDRFIERNEEFLDFAARKRQWLDVYWRVNTGYLLFGRQSWGQGFLINCPLRKRDVAQKLWEQYKVRVDPRLIEFREKDRRTGIQDLGHNWCWLYLPGAEELGIDREVYDNKRVKKARLRLFGIIICIFIAAILRSGYNERKGRVMIRALQKRVLFSSLVLMEPRNYMCTTRRRQDKANKSATDQEDKEELERERHLRERFSQKIQEAMPQYAQQGPESCSSGTCGAQQTPSSMMFFRFMFFLTSLLLLMALLQISDKNSPFNIMQNIPWWQLPLSSVSYFTLMRALLPYREQRRIKEEYEVASRLNPTLTLDQFFSQRYPNMFQGYQTQQQEVVAAVSACLASANDLNFVRTISRAAGSARDIRASVDNIIGTLKREYPHLFQNTGAPPFSSVEV